MIWLHRCYDIQFLESPDIIGMNIFDMLDRISEILSSGSFFRFLVHIKRHAHRTICDTKELREALDLILPNNAQGEYYLPDTLTIIKEKGLKVDAYALDDPEDITGVNDQEQLAAAAVVIRRRIAGNKAKNRR